MNKPVPVKGQLHALNIIRAHSLVINT